MIMMKLKMKYVVVKDRENEERAILFPACNGLWHKDMTRLHRASDVRFVSAAFCDITIIGDNVDVECYGKAESLGKDAKQFAARKEDEEIVKKCFLETKSFEFV